MSRHHRIFLDKDIKASWAVAVVEWLWEETHVLKVVGSNPSTVYWMDIFHIYLFVVTIVMFV